MAAPQPERVARDDFTFLLITDRSECRVALSVNN